MKIKFSKIFDWSIKGVGKPLPTKGQFSVWDVGPDQILFWTVVVEYVHHGRCAYFFGEPDEVAKPGLKKANAFYDKMCAKMLACGAKTR